MPFPMEKRCPGPNSNQALARPPAESGGDSARPATPAPGSAPSRLPPRQAAVLLAIRVSIELRGIAPTVRELAEALELASTNGIAEHLAALERKGFIRREPCRARAIVLTDAGKATP